MFKNDRKLKIICKTIICIFVLFLIYKRLKTIKKNTHLNRLTIINYQSDLTKKVPKVVKGGWGCKGYEGAFTYKLLKLFEKLIFYQFSYIKRQKHISFLSCQNCPTDKLRPPKQQNTFFNWLFDNKIIKKTSKKVIFL